MRTTNGRPYDSIGILHMIVTSTAVVGGEENVVLEIVGKMRYNEQTQRQRRFYDADKTYRVDNHVRHAGADRGHGGHCDRKGFTVVQRADG